jgi:2-iminobutanoate/2-iminopropanoate deaminase
VKIKKIIVIVFAILLVGLLAVQQKAKPSKTTNVEYLSSESTVKMKLPFSEAVRVGNILFLSGKIGMDQKSRKLVPGGIKAETKQTLENIRAVLKRHGSSMDRVVKCTVMLADIAEWAEMNKVYVTYFPKNLPARSAFGASGLAMGARVEIECIATIK